MSLKFVLLMLCLTFVHTYVKKEIPEHLRKKYGLIDPTKQRHTPPDIDLSMHKPKPKDPSRKKTHDEIPRVPDKDIHEEDIPHTEHNHHELHVNDAMREHEIAKVRAELEGKKLEVPKTNLPDGESIDESKLLGKMIQENA